MGADEGVLIGKDKKPISIKSTKISGVLFVLCFYRLNTLR